MPTDYKEHPKLISFLNESLQLSWKLATHVPPMIVSCDEQHYDRKKHRCLFAKRQVPKEHTLEYYSPVLYTNYMYKGRVQAHGQVEIKSGSVTDQPSEDHYGT